MVQTSAKTNEHMPLRISSITSFILPLILAASAILSISFAGKERIYLVTDFGAVADGRTVNTAAIQRAIDQCAEKGGGTVVISQGVFRSGSLFLKQRTNLKIEEGGVLQGTVNPDDYPQIDTRWEGEERKWTACLLNANGLDHIAVSGPGTLDGAGVEWLEKGRTGQRFGRPRLLGFQNCSHIKVSDLLLHNQASWGLFVLYSTDVEISRLTIRAAHTIPSSDGIDIDSGNRIRITKCDIDVNDDCISIQVGQR